ncbi:cation diffusion facilitator family transporter [Bacillus sp. FJAT-27245]|uniref:cation diffusion facilitator family transporter n=1 Tax=Bacillus sp. FJAT-27245 TaxID=1684144 RepID=UPI0018D07D5E|nr:cation diffusion facilitator family transporter [Bacillus sp. FJAT-27245]
MSLVTFVALLKKGNKSSGIAALSNAILAVIKGIAAFMSGSGTMFATTLHSVADSTNQAFVFIGSALAEKAPTRRFPTGFGRVVNLFVLVAVIVISIMSYETVLKGWELIQNPKEPEKILLNVLILLAAIGLDGAVLVKAIKEIVHETRSNAKGLAMIPAAFKNVKLASPPTRLVFYEDIIATSGAALALLAIVLAKFTGLYFLDGVGTLLIGFMLFGIAIKIGYENTVGLIGVAAPRVIEDRIAKTIFSDPDVDDINKLRIVQEGRQYHVEGYIELKRGLSLAVADDIKFRIRDKLLADPDISDVTIGILETDGITDWKPSAEE